MIMEAQSEMITAWKKQIAELQKAAEVLHKKDQDTKTTEAPAA